jgi:Predicted aminopeptidases
MLDQARIEKIVTYLADDMTRGRASGTPGKQYAEQYIVNAFREAGLTPVNWNYTQSFRHDDTTVLRNVVGLIPSAFESDEYIVISAHYDHMGEMGGKIFSGADDNASGVAALISMAELFAKMKRDGKGPRKNLIFVAFDGKELSMAGSRYFVRHLPVPKSKILCNVNMDMLGTDLVPTGKNKEYLILLGEERLPESCRGYASYLSRRVQYRMDLDLTFYGSRDFTRMVLDMSDQKSFAKAGIPAVCFTSAFHQHTYKPTDRPDIINFPLLKKRIMLIFNFINHL